jgi:hypothetical protein
MVERAGSAAVFAAEEFFYGKIRNEHTCRAYLVAVRRFLAWAERRGVELIRITPRDVGQYLDELRGEESSVATIQDPARSPGPRELICLCWLSVKRKAGALRWQG